MVETSRDIGPSSVTRLLGGVRSKGPAVVTVYFSHVLSSSEKPTQRLWRWPPCCPPGGLLHVPAEWAARGALPWPLPAAVPLPLPALKRVACSGFAAHRTGGRKNPEWASCRLFWKLRSESFLCGENGAKRGWAECGPSPSVSWWFPWLPRWAF